MVPEAFDWHEPTTAANFHECTLFCFHRVWRRRVRTLADHAELQRVRLTQLNRPPQCTIKRELGPRPQRRPTHLEPHNARVWQASTQFGTRDCQLVASHARVSPQVPTPAMDPGRCSPTPLACQLRLSVIRHWSGLELHDAQSIPVAAGKRETSICGTRCTSPQGLAPPS